MLDANVHAMLRRTEEATARAVASAESAMPPASGAGLTRAVQRVTRLAGHVHTGRVADSRTEVDPAVTAMIQAATPASEHVAAERDVMRRVLAGAHQQLAQTLGRNDALNDELDEALRDAGDEYKSALGAVGMPAATVALLESWLELQVVTRLVQLQAAPANDERLDASKPTGLENLRGAAAAVEPVDAVGRQLFDMEPPARPDRLVSASELGQLLGVSDQTVRGRERAGELFSILRPGRRRGVEYPAFQAWPAVTGAPLAKVLSALAPVDGGRASGTLAYSFFIANSELLGGLTPLEVLAGQPRAGRVLDEDLDALLSADAATRLAAVERAARTTAQVDAA